MPDMKASKTRRLDGRYQTALKMKIAVLLIFSECKQEEQARFQTRLKTEIQIQVRL